MAPQRRPWAITKLMKISLLGRIGPTCDFKGSGGTPGTPKRGGLGSKREGEDTKKKMSRCGSATIRDVHQEA